jgi:homocysteine S-methyltransferase
VSVPDEIIGRMARPSNNDEARAEGGAIAREMLDHLRGVVQGAQISAPFGKYNAAVDVLEVLGATGVATGAK